MTRNKTALVAATTAVMTAAILGSLQSVAWNGTGAPAVARAFTEWLDPALLLETASSNLEQPSESYFGYGRLVVAIYALLFVAGAALRRLTSQRTFWLLAGLFTIAAMGDIAAYWVSETMGPGVRLIGFWYTEVPALAATTLVLSGIGGWQMRYGGSGRPLVAALPLSIATTALLAYMPHGILLGLALTGVLTLVCAPNELHVASSSASRWSRTRKAVVGLLATIAALVLALMYRPTLVPGPEIPRPQMTITEGLEGSRLHVFNTGYNRMSWLLVGRERPWRPVPVFIVEHPQSGIFVFDTGFSDAVAVRGNAGLHIPERWVVESKGAKSLTLPNQMRSTGLDPEAVHHVVISHLHSDHVGQLEAFPNARIIGGPGTTEFAQANGLVDQWHEQALGVGFRFGPFDDAVDMLGDQSIVLMRGGGHASEGLMLLLVLESGPVLLAGDAVVHSEWLRGNDVQRIPVNKERAAVVRNQVRRFLDTVPDAAVAYGHDLRGIDCNRTDIVCHGQERFYPEELAAPKL